MTTTAPIAVSDSTIVRLLELDRLDEYAELWKGPLSEFETFNALEPAELDRVRGELATAGRSVFAEHSGLYVLEPVVDVDLDLELRLDAVDPTDPAVADEKAEERGDDVADVDRIRHAEDRSFAADGR